MYKLQHFMEPTLDILENGFILNLDSLTYAMEWVGNMLKVTGDNVCYYLVETHKGLEQIDCSLQAISILIAQN